MAFTFGPSGTPGQKTINLDAVFSSSLANYQRTLFDQITKSNPLFHELKQKGLWESVDGGAFLTMPLMYALTPMQAYSGYDVLSTAPTDGITEAVYDWAQAAVPVTMSGLEKIRNRRKIFDLMDAKIQQAEMGIQEGFTKAFIQGSLASGAATGSTNHQTPYVEPSNGATFINPLFQLVAYDATPTNDQADNAITVGGIAAGTYTWWRNYSMASTATTYLGLLLEFDKMYDLCKRGPGGAPDLIWVDETTKRLINAAYYDKYRTQMPSRADYPFDNIRFRDATIVSDEFMIDVQNSTTTPNTGEGTAVFLNTKFIKIKYDSDTNFVSGAFKTPINQDATVKHILWAGQVCTSNRRKHGVIGSIARTLTIT